MLSRGILTKLTHLHGVGLAVYQMFGTLGVCASPVEMKLDDTELSVQSSSPNPEVTVSVVYLH